MSGLAPLRTGQKPGAFRTPSGALWKSRALSTSMGSAAEPEGEKNDYIRQWHLGSKCQNICTGVCDLARAFVHIFTTEITHAKSL